MRIVSMILGLVVAAGPALAQEQPKEGPKEAPKEAPKDVPAEPAKEPAKDDTKPEPPKREITGEGQKLLDDVKLVYSKYYAIVLEKTRANESYKATEVWDTAVKEARNAKYKDSKEWSDAIGAMKRKDKVFQKEVAEYIALKAEEHNKELRKIRGEDEKEEGGKK